jgi:hypothetical protein
MSTVPGRQATTGNGEEGQCRARRRPAPASTIAHRRSARTFTLVPGAGEDDACVDPGDLRRDERTLPGIVKAMEDSILDRIVSAVAQSEALAQ